MHRVFITHRSLAFTLAVPSRFLSACPSPLCCIMFRYAVACNKLQIVGRLYLYLAQIMDQTGDLAESRWMPCVNWLLFPVLLCIPLLVDATINWIVDVLGGREEARRDEGWNNRILYYFQQTGWFAWVAVHIAGAMGRKQETNRIVGSCVYPRARM